MYRLVAAIALIAAAILPSRAADKTLNLYIWSDYLAPDTLAGFTKTTGIKVNVDVFDASEMLEAKMLAGSSGYDVIVPNGPTIARLAKAGTVREIDKTKLPHLGTQDPTIARRAAAMDAGNAHGIVYMWGTSGLGVNTAKVRVALGKDAKLDSWAVLFDPAQAAKLAACGIYVLDSPSDAFSIALAYLGKDPHSEIPADTEAAAALWQKVRPFIAKFHSSEYISALANGDICLALGYSGDIFQARERASKAKNGVEVGYIIPREGAMMWFDFMAIPRDAPHPDAAHAFLDYILRPEVIGAVSNAVYYANANAQSAPFVNKALRDDRSVYPDPAVMGRLFPELNPPQAIERLRTRLWNRIKAGT